MRFYFVFLQRKHFQTSHITDLQIKRCLNRNNEDEQLVKIQQHD